MITWNGISVQFQDGLVRHYSIKWPQFRWRLCDRYANIIFGGSYNSEGETLTWGYAGEGPKRTAALLLLYAFRNPTDLSQCSLAQPPTKAERLFVFKHLDKFHREVIAKLPDNWRMTDADIWDWISKQPKENENQTNAGHQAETAPVQSGQGSENRGG